MSREPIRRKFEHRGFSGMAKANPASVEGMWFPSYQIDDESVNAALEHPNPVDGTVDVESSLEAAEQQARQHIDTVLAR